jgi:hypothetical protein
MRRLIQASVITFHHFPIGASAAKDLTSKTMSERIFGLFSCFLLNSKKNSTAEFTTTTEVHNHRPNYFANGGKIIRK